VRHITSRIRAAIGAAMIVAFASPVAAHAQRPAARVRVEAQWLEGRGASRPLMRWRMVHRRMAVAAWHRGYARGFTMGRYPVRASIWRRAYGQGFARGRLYGRFWERQRLGRMGGRWSL
jgi:hypothetical protein